jgi:acetyl-CoA acetyltransferase
MDLCVEAVSGALADAGLVAADVDGVLVDWPGPGGVQGQASSWARLLGRPVALSSDSIMDNAGVRGVLKGAAMITAGYCETVLVGGGSAGTLRSGPVGSGEPMEFSDVWGCYVIPQFALVAARHMKDYGTTAVQIASTAATIRNHATGNPEAVMGAKGPYTVDDILGSPMVSSPLHLLEVCIAAEGGAALVMTTEERARDLKHAPVVVAGGGMSYMQAAYANPALLREVGDLGRVAATEALQQADINLPDIDVFSLYDPNAFEIIRAVEAIGLCPPGDGGPLAESGGFDVSGAFPVNPDGGCLAHSWNGTQQMTIRVIEGVRQLRGTANRQVPEARHALVANAGSGAQHIEILVLGSVM